MLIIVFENYKCFFLLHLINAKLLETKKSPASSKQIKNPEKTMTSLPPSLLFPSTMLNPDILSMLKLLQMHTHDLHGALGIVI